MFHSSTTVTTKHQNGTDFAAKRIAAAPKVLSREQLRSVTGGGGSLTGRGGLGGSAPPPLRANNG